VTNISVLEKKLSGFPFLTPIFTLTKFADHIALNSVLTKNLEINSSFL
jgi:hypothetical protein